MINGLSEYFCKVMLVARLIVGHEHIKGVVNVVFCFDKDVWGNYAML